MKLLNKLRKLREKKGFTLVELIVVIAIIAILTAVLVPLIGNWTQQAAYTTLQDAASTVSNTVNEAISKITMGGAPASITSIEVTKTSGTFDIKIDGGAVNVASPSTTADKIGAEVKNMLEATLPQNCGIYITVSNGAVTGVVYRNDSATVTKTGTVDAVDDFNEAYQVGTQAVGVAGKFKSDGATIS